MYLVSDWKHKLHEYASGKIRPRSRKQRANIVNIYSELIRYNMLINKTNGDFNRWGPQDK